MPAVNWIDLHTTGDLANISKTGKICKRAISVFEELRDQVIDTFGASEEYLKLHHAKIELELLECERLWTNDNSLAFHIEMGERNIQLLSKPQDKVDIYNAFIWIKKQGISIEENKVTAFWFYKYLKFLNDEAKKLNRNGRK